MKIIFAYLFLNKLTFFTDINPIRNGICSSTFVAAKCDDINTISTKRYPLQVGDTIYVQSDSSYYIIHEFQH